MNWLMDCNGPEGTKRKWRRHGGRPAVIRLLLSICVFTGVADSPASAGDDLATRFRSLTRTNAWQRVAVVPLDFDSHHSQGLARVGDRFYLSAVEAIDRDRGLGRGHLFEFGLDGHLLRRASLGRNALYHPGGMDYDGRHLWVPVAEYRPDSRSVICRVDPATLAVEEMFEVSDHIGVVVCRRPSRLVGLTWGGRRYWAWRVGRAGRVGNAAGDGPEPNGAHYVDYQDGQAITDSPLALFGGVATRFGSAGERAAVGGLELVDLRTRRAVHQIPLELWTAGGRPMLQNAFHAELAGGSLRFWFLPEDGRSRLYVYEVR